MDALLIECLARRPMPNWQKIADELHAAGFGRRGRDAVQQRAQRLELTGGGNEDGPLDCRRFGDDRLLAALAAAHWAPPADVTPPRRDARPMNWRRLVAETGSGAGSPAALCAAAGGPKNW